MNIDKATLRRYRLLSARKWFAEVPPRPAANLNTVDLTKAKPRRPVLPC